MTSFNDIFELFSSIVTDDDFILFGEEYTQQTLILLLKRAIPLFEYPKVSLEYDLEKLSFVEKLDDAECGILADLMAELWLRNHLFDKRIAQAEYIDKDFSIKQQEQLKALTIVYESTRKERQYMQRMYNRRTNKGKSANYSSLAGGVL